MKSSNLNDTGAGDRGAFEELSAAHLYACPTPRASINAAILDCPWGVEVLSIIAAEDLEQAAPPTAR